MNAAQCKMARAATGLGVRELAASADVSPNTIARLERGENIRVATVDAIRAALEAAGVEFIPENGGGAGVRLRKAARPSSAPTEGEAGIIESSDM
jgi:transcriptional regulator with XRE-family HTH domain